MSFLDVLLLILVVAKIFGLVTFGWGLIIGIIVARWVIAVLFLVVLGVLGIEASK